VDDSAGDEVDDSAGDEVDDSAGDEAEVTAAIKVVQVALIQPGQVPWLEWGSELLPNLMQRLADEAEESIEDLEADFSRCKGDIDDRYLEEDWTDEAHTSALANLENEFLERRAQAEERRVRKLRNGWYGWATRAREERAQSVGEKETGERCRLPRVRAVSSMSTLFCQRRLWMSRAQTKRRGKRRRGVNPRRPF
jgi:hypothetical protein